jgi:serine/threonine-protein kinase
MPLAPGDKLGPYEVVSLLGKGGMGEVYRARDPKLNRDVAIKVLPAALANDADYLARFQREAQTLAALNHPNIATIYGLEGNAIVMELVEGPTLQCPLPLEEALPVARQIAEALEAAHDKGIIHRDLKPGNVKVTPEGVVKVLDFGLAKAVNERPVTTGPDSPTLTLRATEAGLILGTAGYMSPEQAAGKSVDRRADIWAFAVVLYELLIGKRLFDGETVTHTLADVVRKPIDLEGVPLKELIGRCLDRNLKSRLQHIGEARIAIERYEPPKSETVRTKASWWPWAIAAASLILAPLIGWYTATRPAPPRPLIRVEIQVPPATPLAPLALSPDGARLALTLRSPDGKVRLHTRLLHQTQFTPLPGTEDAHGPFFSPAGDWIGFFADGKLKKIAVEGGAAVTLCDARLGYGASWGDDGNIVAALDIRTTLSRIPSAGGTPTPLTKLNANEVTHR